MLFVVGSVCGCCVCGLCNCVCLVAVFGRYCVVVFGWVVLFAPCDLDFMFSCFVVID